RTGALPRATFDSFSWVSIPLAAPPRPALDLLVGISSPSWLRNHGQCQSPLRWGWAGLGSLDSTRRCDPTARSVHCGQANRRRLELQPRHPAPHLRYATDRTGQGLDDRALDIIDVASLHFDDTPLNRRGPLASFASVLVKAVLDVPLDGVVGPDVGPE